MTRSFVLGNNDNNADLYAYIAIVLLHLLSAPSICTYEYISFYLLYCKSIDLLIILTDAEDYVLQN